MPDTIELPSIPKRVLDAYTSRYPHLRTLANNLDVPSLALEAARVFAQSACQLSAPSLSIRDIWDLAGVAEGKPWPSDRHDHG